MQTTKELKYLNYLAELYPTITKASTEIINLKSILNLPKGTEHFMSDLHGEYDAFSHVLKTGSGAIRKKIEEIYSDRLSLEERRDLANLIYYPEESLQKMKKTGYNNEEWYHQALLHLIEVCKTITSKYTRSKVRKALPEEYAYIIEELITEKSEITDKEAYYKSIVDTILDLERSEHFIIAICKLIQRLVVDHLHIVGDIFDRGKGPHLILDHLMNYHSLDIQWGNHDILWMGAAAGNPACIATVVRLAIRHNRLSVLEDAYGINMLPLATFALETYPIELLGTCYTVHTTQGFQYSDELYEAKMHKAITLIQLKLEGQLIKEHPEFNMDDRLLLDKINYEDQTIEIDGVKYTLEDTVFPTVDREDPYALTAEEQEIMDKLVYAFLHSEKLQTHMKFLLKQGSLYKVFNGNLLYHGCIPMNEDGSFKEVNVYGKTYAGKELFDVLEKYIRGAYFSKDDAHRKLGRDLMWYLWNGPDSPLFGREKKTTFERYYIKDSSIYKEKKSPYYTWLDKEETAIKILKEFGLEGPGSYIINGHVPVHQKSGESPIKGGGRALIIDGGFSDIYHDETGIAGYTLVSSSHRLVLAAHNPFESIEDALRNDRDSFPDRIIVEVYENRKMVGDTDAGKKLKEYIEELKELISAYRSGQVKGRVERNN